VELARRDSSVAIRAMPMLPPMFRERLKKPDAAFICCGGIPFMQAIVRGTKMKPRERPMMMRGKVMCQ
jgi:hypothetical protein